MFDTSQIPQDMLDEFKKGVVDKEILDYEVKEDEHAIRRTIFYRSPNRLGTLTKLINKKDGYTFFSNNSIRKENITKLLELTK